MAVEASVYGGVYTENNIMVYYYTEPTYEEPSQTGSPANIEKPILIKANFDWTKNDPVQFEKHGNFSCRFTSSDGKKVVYTKAKMERDPIGSTEGLPTHLKCTSPMWHGADPGARLDFSVNGMDYTGGYTYVFTESLDLYRIVPMSGPLKGNTTVRLYGSGYNSSKEDVHFRWGTYDTELELR